MKPKTLPNKKWLFLPAFLFTLAGDYFLTITQSNITVGIFLFCVVQTIYAIYLGMGEDGRVIVNWREVALRTALWAFLIFIIAIIGQRVAGIFNLASVLAMLDISLLGVNAVIAFRRSNIIFAIGLLLFFFCDICVGLSTIVQAGAYETIFRLIWVFYIPSQILIWYYALSKK